MWIYTTIPPYILQETNSQTVKNFRKSVKSKRNFLLFEVKQLALQLTNMKTTPY
jgi:hypothetical protein